AFAGADHARRASSTAAIDRRGPQITFRRGDGAGVETNMARGTRAKPPPPLRFRATDANQRTDKQLYVRHIKAVSLSKGVSVPSCDSESQYRNRNLSIPAIFKG